MSFIKELSVLSLILFLIGCDNSNQPTSLANENKEIQTTTQSVEENSLESSLNQNSQPTAQLVEEKPLGTSSNQNSQTSAQSVEKKSSEAKSAHKNQSNSVFTVTPELKEKYKNKHLTVLDSSEVMLDGSSTLVITFSVPLNPKLNFSNLLRLVDKEKGNVDGAWELSDNGLELRHRFLEPNRKLTLTIDKMLSAINDSQLSAVYQTELTTQNRQPFIGFASTGLLLPSKSMSGIPVNTLNVNKVDVNFFRIKPEKLSEFITNVGFINFLPNWRSSEISPYMDLVYSSRFDLNPKPNAQETLLLNLSAISELNKEGVYLAVMNEAGKYPYENPASLFSISNVGVAIHAYQNGKLMVMTHALDDGKPLPNINLSLLCAKNTTADNKHCLTLSTQTDNEGFAELTISEGDHYSLLIANDGNQTSFVNIDRNALNLTEFNLSGSTFYSKQLFVFGPRDLYRPNETIYFNALLRDADGQMLPDQPIIVDVLSPDGKSTGTYNLKRQSDSHGLYQFHLTIPSDAATGKWALRFNLGDDNYRFSYFGVEEFLPERMAMEITAPSDHPMLIGNDIEFDIKGRYLYGAPASGNKLTGQVYLKKLDSIKGFDDYKIGSITDKNVYKELETIDNTLDNSGLNQIKLDSNKWSRIKMPVRVVMQASLLDSGGRPVTRYATQDIWPAEQMPILRVLFSESPYYDWKTDKYDNRPTVDVGEIAEFEVAYINMLGKKLATNNLKARVVRERNDYYWSWSDDDGWREIVNEKEFVVSENKLTIGENSTATVRFQPDDYGSYRVEIIDPKTNIISSLRFWVGYDWEDNTRGTNSVRPDQVKLSIDKTSYAYGDTAKVHVQAPVAGSGYISLETNDGTLWKKEITLGEEGLEVEIPIKNWARHDVYINAMIIRPSTDTAVQTVKRAVGLLYLPIDTSNRQLNLTIDAPKVTEPEKIVPIKIKMDKQAVNKGQKVTVLVSAVDSGVLNITDFKTPDPYTAFLGRKRYNVDQYDVYGKLIEATGRTINMTFGGDAIISGGKKPLTEVQIVAQQLKTIQLNKDGEGIVELALPNFNGELRLMAQAWDDNRFGKAEQIMTVASPVVTELSMPRFLSGGDQAVLALDIHNLTDLSQTMQVEVKTTGLVHQNSSNATNLKLDSKQKKILQIPVIADYGYGQGTINVSIKGIKLNDNPNYEINRSWKLGVRPAYSATDMNYSFAINGGESWQFSSKDMDNLIGNTVGAKLIISNQPPLNIAQYIKELFAYPYGCLEQTTSGLFPSLYANSEQLAALGIETESDENRRQKIQLGISRILSMQRNNGSFGLWNSESNEEYWLTVYATDFLLQAKERGYQVSDSALNSAMTRIGQYIYDSSSFNNMEVYYRDSKMIAYSKLTIKAYALMILAKQNKITSAMRNEIYSLSRQIMNENIALSPLPIAQLALTAKLIGNKELYQNLMEEVDNTIYDNQNGWYYDYGSDIRDEALVLALLLENDIGINLQPDYLFSLSDSLSNKRYFSTQELNALFIAGWSLEQHKSKKKFKVSINDKVKSANTSLKQSYDFEDIKHGLTISNPQNDMPLYINMTVSGYAKTPPAPTPEQNDLTISRSYYDLNGKSITPSKIDVGTVMFVMLDIKSKERIQDGLIVDFLPAGLELENQNLTGSSINLDTYPALVKLLSNENSGDVKYQEYRDDRYVTAVDIGKYYQSHKRVGYLVRAVTPGNYVVPQPYVESMYRPELFAIGRSLDMMAISQPK